MAIKGDNIPPQRDDSENKQLNQHADQSHIGDIAAAAYVAGARDTRGDATRQNDSVEAVKVADNNFTPKLQPADYQVYAAPVASMPPDGIGSKKEVADILQWHQENAVNDEHRAMLAGIHKVVLGNSTISA